jgi:hypothetical protein
MNNSLSILLALLCGLLAPVAASLRGTPLLSAPAPSPTSERHPLVELIHPPSINNALQNDTYNEDCELLHALAIQGSLDEIKMLLEEKPRLVRSQDDKGWTALHEAARHGQLQVARFLLHEGAELDARTMNGESALDEAEKYNGQESAIYRYLLAARALNLEVKTLLRGGHARPEPPLPTQLVGKGRMDELKQLLDLEGPHSVAEGATPSYHNNQNQRSFEQYTARASFERQR